MRLSSRKSSAPTPKNRWARFWRGLGNSVYVLLLAAGTAWAATALSFHIEGTALILAETGLAALTLSCLYARTRARRAGWAGLALATLLIAGWYQTIRPSQDRIWAFDVAHGVAPVVNGDLVTLNNVRAFRWTDDSHADQAWVSHTYDLTKLASIDMLTSTWGNPDIAHLLVSFGFSDGQRVVFSVEIRKESHESYSTIGGFFREFEQVLIAAEEEDIIKLRTNYRDEDVHLYPIRLDTAGMRQMFLAYVGLGQKLQAKPAFYNTLTANCTTTVYQLAQRINPDMPFDIRLIKSGGLPGYLADLGGLQGDLTPEDRFKRSAITQLARSSTDADFSRTIRRLN